MNQVSLGSPATEFTAYASVEVADAYMTAALHGDTWRAASADEKGMALVTATRTLDRQNWKGTKVATDQPLAWPRANTGISPDPVEDEFDIPVDIVNASIELALSLLEGGEAQNQASTADRIAAMSAGSVSITYRRDADNPTRFPTIVQELVRNYIGGLGSGYASKATGVDGLTDFPGDYGFGVGGL